MSWKIRSISLALSVRSKSLRQVGNEECTRPQSARRLSFRMAGLIEEKYFIATRKSTVNTMSKEILKFVSKKCINDITTIAEKQVLWPPSWLPSFQVLLADICQDSDNNIKRQQSLRLSPSFNSFRFRVLWICHQLRTVVNNNNNNNICFTTFGSVAKLPNISQPSLVLSLSRS